MTDKADTPVRATENDNPIRSIQHAPLSWKTLSAFALFVVAIIIAGYATFLHYKEIIKIDKQNELGAINELKTGQITHWIDERRGDAQALVNDPQFQAEARRWLQQGSPSGETRGRLLERLSSLQKAYAAYGYTSIDLFDDRAVLRLSSSGDKTPLQGSEKEGLLESIRSGQIVFSDVHRKRINSDEKIEIELRAPLALGKNGKASTLGAVLFRIDPTRYIFPIIQHWPTPSPSAESLLFRHEGDEAVFLSELRQIKNTPLAMHFPLNQSQLLATQAIMAVEGELTEGLDYRGVPVAGVMTKVPGTTWYLLSKMDQVEIYAPINHLKNWFLVLMLLFAGAGVGFAAYLRQNEILKFRGELERQGLKRHLYYLFKNSNDIILLIDHTGKVIDFNDRALEGYGYTAAEFSGLSWSCLRAIEYTHSFTEKFKQIDLAGGMRLESTHVKKDGTFFPVEINMQRADIDGEKLYQIIVRDITERKHDEAMLRKSSKEIEDLYNNAACGYHSLDTNGIIRRINDTELEWLGYTRDEVIGKRKLSDFMTPASQKLFRNSFPRFIKQGITLNREIELVRKDGTIFLGLVNATAIYDPSGNFVMSRSTVLDITERKHAEDMLRFHSEILENLSEGVLLVRPDTGEIVFTNSRLNRILGYKSGELIGRNVCLINAPGNKSPETLAREINDTLSTHGRWDGEVNNIKKDGTRIWCQVSVSIFDHPQFGTVGISVHEDITERKILEKALHEKRNDLEEVQKLHIAAQTASAIAHELNQPLLAIATYSEAVLMLLKAANPDHGKIRDALEKTKQQAHRAGKSIHEIFAFLNAREFPVEDFDLNREIVMLLDDTRREQELQFHSTLCLEDGFLWVRANRTHVQKALLNLLHNGIQAMREADVPLPDFTMTVRTSHVGNAAQVTIQDNGPGFRKEDAQRLFEPFFTTKVNGFGMGLAISRSLIELNGGRLWVEPQEDNQQGDRANITGATFHLTLPFAP